MYSHVMVVELPKPVGNTLLFSHAMLTRHFTEGNCFHVVDDEVISKLTKPVPGKQAALVGLHSRPDRKTIDEWVAALGGRKSHIMLGHKVWSEPNNLYSTFHVTANRHRVVFNDRQQVLWDVALADNFRKRTPHHHPVAVSDYYRALGCRVNVVHAEHGLDHRPIRYDASLQLGNTFDHTGLTSIGRYRMFSGLLVPA